MFIGALLLLIGILMVLERMDIIHGSVWGYLVPVALIALGLDFIFKRSHRRR